MKSTYTKKQQDRIDKCYGKLKERMTEYFDHVNGVKRCPAYREFMKAERQKQGKLGVR